MNLALDLSRHPWRVYRVGSDEPQRHCSSIEEAHRTAGSLSAITGIQHYVVEPESFKGTHGG
jgi:hypothetical protein